MLVTAAGQSLESRQSSLSLTKPDKRAVLAAYERVLRHTERQSQVKTKFYSSHDENLLVVYSHDISRRGATNSDT